MYTCCFIMDCNSNIIFLPFTKKINELVRKRVFTRSLFVILELFGDILVFL